MTHKIVVTALCSLIMLPTFSKRMSMPSEQPGAIIEITSVDQFDSILRDIKPKIIKFYNPNCPHCKKVKKLYEELATKFPYIAFLAVNAHTNAALAQRYKVQRVPVFIILDKQSKQVTRINGEVKKSALQSQLEPLNKIDK